MGKKEIRKNDGVQRSQGRMADNELQLAPIAAGGGCRSPTEREGSLEHARLETSSQARLQRLAERRYQQASERKRCGTLRAVAEGRGTWWAEWVTHSRGPHRAAESSRRKLAVVGGSGWLTTAV